MAQFSRQGSTTWQATVMGGPRDLVGRFVLADKVQVEDQAWWDRHPDIRVIIQCADHAGGGFGQRQPFRYPVQLRHFKVDARDTQGRQAALEAALPAVEAALREGKDVLLHCMNSFHRAPVVAAAFHKRLTGKPVQAGLYL